MSENTNKTEELKRLAIDVLIKQVLINNIKPDPSKTGPLAMSADSKGIAKDCIMLAMMFKTFGDTFNEESKGERDIRIMKEFSEENTLESANPVDMSDDFIEMFTEHRERTLAALRKRIEELGEGG